MIENKSLCMNCMNLRGTSLRCPHCGSTEVINKPEFITAEMIIHKRYLIGSVIRTSGDSTTYIAYDMENDRAVEVIEYHPQSLCIRSTDGITIIPLSGEELVYREFMKDFSEIYSGISMLSDYKAMPEILDTFEENNTVYAICNHKDCISLRDYIYENGVIPWEQAQVMFLPVLSAVIAAHSIGLTHYGISPNTILVDTNDKLTLTGFGIPEARIIGTELKPFIFDGFAAIEQYSAEDKKGKWTDVYGLASTLFFILTNEAPPSAPDRMGSPGLKLSREIVDSIPAHVISALADALQVLPEKRLSSVERLKSELIIKAGSFTVDSGNMKPAKNGRRPYTFDEDDTPAYASRSKYVNEKLGPQIKKSRKFENEESPAEPSKILLFFKKIFTLSPNQKMNLKYGAISAGISLVVLLLLGFALYSIIFGKSDNGTVTTPSGSDNLSSDSYISELTYYDLPDFTGQLYSDVTDHFPMFKLYIVEEKFDETYPAGYILSQSVEEGTQCAEGSPIGVIVSSGSDSTTIPKIIGVSVSEADVLLTNANLHLGEQTEEYSSTYDFGEVIKIVGYSEGDNVSVDSYINVIVSKGPQG